MAKAKKKMKKLSPSSLNLFVECPRCFWLRFRKGIKRPEHPFPSLPGGMDKILKAHFDKFREKDKLPPELKQEGINAKLFKNMDKLRIWRNNFKGVSYEHKSGRIIHGAVDELLKKDGKLIVLDFKTRGYPCKEDTASHYQEQLDIYNFLLQKNNYKTMDYSYLLFFYPQKVNKDGSVLFDTELVKMDISLKSAENIINEAIECLNGNMPEPAEDCSVCGYVGKLY